jgi:hypothetical protein
MNDMVTFSPGANLPAHIANNPPPMALNANAQQGIRIPFPVVSIEGRVWSVTTRGVETVIRQSPGFDVNHKPLPPVPTPTLNVIVVGISPAISKSWYAAAFRPGVKILMPDCFSTDGERPDQKSPRIQSTSCATCPKNQFGSAISDDGTEGKGKACRDGRKIAVVPAGDVKNKSFGGAPMMLRLPVMSMPNLARYCGELNISGIDISQVVTQMSFNMDVRYPEVVFTALGYVQDPDDYRDALEWMRSDIVRQMLDEAPTFENTGVSPKQPTRSDFSAPPDDRGQFVIEADIALNDEPEPEAWLERLLGFAGTATNIGDLTALFSLGCVRSAREMAPLEFRQRIQKALDDAVDRLSPKDVPVNEQMPPEPTDEQRAEARATIDRKRELAGQKDEPEMERDVNGVAWDAALHASSKAKNSDGTWRARRGAGTAQPAQEPRQQEQPLFGRESETAAGDNGTTTVAGAAATGGVESSSGPVSFEAWLIDGEGNEIPDENGEIEAFTDPVAFVTAYMDALHSKPAATVDLFKRANLEAIRKAQIASTKVSAILAGYNKPAVEAPSLIVPPPAHKTMAEYNAYNDRLRAALTNVNVDGFRAIKDANADTIAAFPPARRLAALAVFEERMKALTPAPARDPVPRNAKDGMLADLESLETIAQIQAWEVFPATIAELRQLDDRDQADIIARTAHRKSILAAALPIEEKSAEQLYQYLWLGLTSCQSMVDYDRNNNAADTVKAGERLAGLDPEKMEALRDAARKQKALLTR